MKQIILGTAGHIDHGKTSLIKAITGIDTDRLKEEKARGITIELGFASLDLPSGQHLGIVDVPGHEKFVKNMVAGATGIDLVVMVIAADEGVMPQTREHMEICSLLDIRHGLVALTKIDLVDEEMLELALEDVKEFVTGTFLEDTPIIPVSVFNEEGLQAFIAALDALCRQVPERVSTDLFRLPIDRVFSMKGFGTVITGTLVSGKVAVGDPVMIYPSGVTSKVRGIQVHNQRVNEARAGMRTAINFQGLEKEAIQRGEILAKPHTLKPSYMVDVSFNYLASNKKPIKSRSRVRFHTGTSEVLGNLILLDRDELTPGSQSIAQLRLDNPVAVVRGDRYVIRRYSPIFTIGGGEVLNPIPSKHKRYKSQLIKNLEDLVKQPLESSIAYHVAEAGFRGVSFGDLKIMTSLSDKALDSTLQGLLSNKTLILLDKESRTYVHTAIIDSLKRTTVDTLEKYHRDYPLKHGVPKEELKSKFPQIHLAKLFNLTLNQMIKEDSVVQEDNLVRLTAHKVSLGVDQSDLKNKFLGAYRQAGLQPPYFKEIVASLQIDAQAARDVLMHLVNEGSIVKTKDDLFFHADAIEDLKQRLISFLQSRGEITTPQFKEMTGASRKFVIPLAEYFDSQNVTLRVGETRKLRKK